MGIAYSAGLWFSELEGPARGIPSRQHIDMRGIGFQGLVFLAFFSAAWGPAILHAQEATVLKPRLIPGTESVVRITGTTVMDVPRGGDRSEQKVDVEQRHTVFIDGHEDEKSKHVRVTVNSIAMEMEMPGMIMRYDSTDPATKDAVLGATFKKLINNPVNMVYDESDEFVKMASSDAFSKGRNAPFGQQIGPEQIKQMVRSSLSEGFPDEAVSPGDSWTYTLKIPIPGVGDMVFDVEYRYRNDRFIEDRSCAIVDVKGALKAESMAPPSGGDPGAVLRADDGFKKGSLEGVVAVDKILRVIQESEITLDMVMKMPSPLGQDEVTIPMRQETSTNLLSFRELR
jgi:hypothetical protein